MKNMKINGIADHDIRFRCCFSIFMVRFWILSNYPHPFVDNISASINYIWAVKAELCSLFFSNLFIQLELDDRWLLEHEWAYMCLRVSVVWFYDLTHMITL